MFGYFKRRSETPIEDRDYSKHYFIMASILFLSTMWVVIDETFTRAEYKSFQKDFYNQLVDWTDEAVQKADADLNKPRTLAQLEKVQASLEAAKEAMFSEDYIGLTKEFEVIETKITNVSKDWRFARANSDELYYNFTHARALGKDYSKDEAKLREVEKKIEELFQQLEGLKAGRSVILDKLSVYKLKITQAEDEIQKIMSEKNAAISKADAAKNKKVEIKQVILEKFTRNNFEQIVDEIDRCASCHLQVTENVFVATGDVFKKHPEELLKIHDWESIGCVSCHNGQGRSLQAGFAHGWEDHYWEHPMYEKSYTEAGCFKCHTTQLDLPQAPQLSKGNKLIADFGCQGCHVLPINLNLGKVGPGLNNIAKKTSPEWIADWLKQPEKFAPNTRMPNFYLTDEQTNDITAYLLSVSKESDFKTAYKYDGSGNSSKGKSLVADIGCMACHAIDDWKSKNRIKEGTAFGADLNRSGNKLNADWLMDWLINPKHYDPETNMPSMRLTTQEAKDITAYLMSKKDPAYKPSVSLASNLNDPKRIEKGLNLVKELGCYGCHTMKGTEGLGNVSVNLSKFSTKTVHELDFGNANTIKVKYDRPTNETAFAYTEGKTNDDGIPDVNTTEYSWYGWLRGKLSHSRRYTTERIQTLMPDFRMTQEEVEAVTTAMLAWDGVWHNDKYKQSVSNDLADGRLFIRENNCVGCHLVEGRGSFLAERIKEDRNVPPSLQGSGVRFQEKWLLDFLENPYPVRPWMNVRMPSFNHSDDEWNRVMKYFLSVEGEELKFKNYKAPTTSTEFIATGKALYDYFKCQQCHVMSEKGPFGEGINAPNLSIASSRLKPDFLPKWLKNPTEIQAGTRMPGYFAKDKNTYPYYDGDAEKQIRALTDYMLSLKPR